MKDLNKVNVLQLYKFWKNLSIALLLLIMMQVVGIWCSTAYTIVAAVVSIVVLQAIIYIDKTSQHPTYVIVCHGLKLSIEAFATITLVLNLLYQWGLIEYIDGEFLFVSHLNLSFLLLAPLCCIFLIVVYVRRKEITRKQNRRYGINTDEFIKGKLGAILTHESKMQMRNLIVLFGVVSVVQWFYYLYIYNIGLVPTGRDMYVFFWLSLFAYVGYEVYLFVHYYSLNLDLESQHELITPHELNLMSSKTYYRFYVSCDNKVFVSFECEDIDGKGHKVLDTPFFVAVYGEPKPEHEVRELIEAETGVKGGELKHFYTFQTLGLDRHEVVRYFYFLDHIPADVPNLDGNHGEWLTYDDILKIYRKRPHSLSSFLVADTARILTITRAASLFDENGNRRSKLKTFVPEFNLRDVRTSDIDYQSNKWIDVANFNENTPFFKLRRWFRRAMRRSYL